MSSEYRDRWISCDDDAVVVRGYYFPWGTKRIPYAAIKGVQRVNIGAATGKLRVWGTANPRLWASLDPGRSRKRVALIVDTGGPVKAFLTPDDPQRMIDAIGAHTGPGVFRGGRARIV